MGKAAGPAPDGLAEAATPHYLGHRERVRDRAWPQPVIAGKKLYLRDQDTLLVYDIKK